jgi:L-ascorbate 6-phosphate lactonase
VSQTSLAQRIKSIQPEGDQTALFWLGQAGFVLKSPDGTVLFIDAYLSHSVERKFGPQWKRIMPLPMEAEDVDCDWFISTHEHDDHLDVDSIPAISRNPRVHFAGPRECMAYYSSAGIDGGRCVELSSGKQVQMGDFTCTAVFADHGDQAPDAVGLIIERAGMRIYHTGDTAFRPEQMQHAISLQPQVILPCINGAFGNLNDESAAQLVGLTGSKLVIPTHFWTFIEHMGDPWQFQKNCQVTAPQAQVKWLTQGEGMLVSADSPVGIRSGI